MNSVRMDNISWVEYEQRVKAGSIVFPPCGATEQHGPHLPLGTDALLASAISEDVAREVAGIVASAISYGYKSQPRSGGGQHFCGTTSVDGATLSGTIRDAVREFHRHGVRRLVIVVGHFENQWFVTEGDRTRDAGHRREQRDGSHACRALGVLSQGNARCNFPERVSWDCARTCHRDRDVDDAPLSPATGVAR
ncbi:hypothetical protein R69919_02645 [Paraburkholderia gardini]|nr:hypothetical protein R69919_02645 [Paraburkholderia gardini]